MIVIPAVDIKGGKCVRLFQGRMEDETVFSDDPAAMALKWEQKGGRIIHLVDLDGAIEKKPSNLAAIKAILKALTVPFRSAAVSAIWIQFVCTRTWASKESLSAPRRSATQN